MRTAPRARVHELGGAVILDCCIINFHSEAAPGSQQCCIR
jgi:hypothetical protein